MLCLRPGVSSVASRPATTVVIMDVTRGTRDNPAYRYCTILRGDIRVYLFNTYCFYQRTITFGLYIFMCRTMIYYKDGAMLCR